ncbi:MAG: orotidine-5'-phosphate decarboxylase [Elusimicrobia bacterium]|nr:orotidine-5'-phosphate decarboxylase [Elusimicrobiota bacterium]MDE2237116.1 orotidine-5'-phosphate decarboxylase [Elusimicrobiota bacterium]MDE2425188.1 orotidine-5'-phosphate decarboxylase [Elusimicrobiota bacterium]
MTEVIVALDVGSLEQERELLERLRGTIGFFKIGLQLFTAHGRQAVELARRHGARVFLDLKLHDIPRTVALAVRQAQNLGAESVSLHLSGGAAMLRSAREVSPRPKLWGVTMLTSLTDADAKVFGAEARLKGIAESLARLGRREGVDATICSPLEVEALRRALGGGTFVTPGIRPAGAELADQKRVMSPEQAAALGVDFIVVGRPITQAPDPLRAAQDVLAAVKAGHSKAPGAP